MTIPQHLPAEIEAGSVYLKAEGDRVLHGAPAVESMPGVVTAWFGPFRKADAGAKIVEVSRHHSRTFPKKVTDFKVPEVPIVEGTRIEFIHDTEAVTCRLLVHRGIRGPAGSESA